TLLSDGETSLPAPIPYREFVAHTLHQAATLDAKGFFSELLGDVNEPTLPFGLKDIHGDGSRIEADKGVLEPGLSKVVRTLSKERKISPATLFHAAWALVVAACSGRDDVV
ncbi:hypothetical protein, partial [Pseudoalteromonas sp. MMG007]|uniref:hypothetical protein n=1 Tax=Pseudoalteromonas sp. MMG007 TaxID=2822684 RepID=UPI001B35CF3D